MDWTVRIKDCKGRIVRTASTATPAAPSASIGSSTSAKLARKRLRTSRGLASLRRLAALPHRQGREATSSRLPPRGRDVVPDDAGRPESSA
jgi:hypothetical protein